MKIGKQEGQGGEREGAEDKSRGNFTQTEDRLPFGIEPTDENANNK